MPADGRELFLIERSGLVEALPRERQLPDVVEQQTGTQELKAALRVIEA